MVVRAARDVPGFLLLLIPIRYDGIPQRWEAAAAVRAVPNAARIYCRNYKVWRSAWRGHASMGGAVGNERMAAENSNIAENFAVWRVRHRRQSTSQLLKPVGSNAPVAA